MKHISWVVSAILALIMALALVGFDSPITSAADVSISADGIYDCQTISIKKATKIFRRLDGTRSRNWEWKRVGPTHLKHVNGPKLRGIVPDNHFVKGKWNPKWNMEGKLIVKKRFSLWCLPDSGTYSTDHPPIACPPTADDAVFMYGGNPGSWDVHYDDGTSYLYYNGGYDRLGAFTMPFQAFGVATRWPRSKTADYYTPGDSVRPSSQLSMVCWGERR
ncbi:MAG: hypothetical protein ACWGQW_23055 [bacterium]